jgi:hypothetical protein
MFNTIVGAEFAGAASRYGSGCDQMMRLLAAPAPQHWLGLSMVFCFKIAFSFRLMEVPFVLDYFKLPR